MVRFLLVSAGLALTALAALGAFLPVLPTTPFLLLAAACFARSSPGLHQRLLRMRVFGPYLAQWEEDRTIPAEAKRRAFLLVLGTFGASIAIVDATWQRVMLLGIGLALLAFLAWLPSTSSRAERADRRPGSVRMD